MIRKSQNKKIKYRFNLKIASLIFADLNKATGLQTSITVLTPSEVLERIRVETGQAKEQNNCEKN